ncbi:acetate--CoA ligase family protein [Thalassobacter stenotrophicus]|uniref:acetate--CoA ligase family protein n=1 Tax=Thalassobacter stenotrophicus TaxID=266809 RepID=UPI0022A97565|nr:acetate--CoA ligase family protein [Thalassobacter stenotrophicus]UYP67565.1 acetate--CoA ligase family protein [Thalassobacter stenotrophicus]
MLDNPLKKSPLDALFRPRTVALVGVSDRLNSYGCTMERVCRAAGFRGEVYGINPRLIGRDERTFGDLAELPVTPEHVVVSVGTSQVETAVAQALASGARALTLFAECPDVELRTRIGSEIMRSGAVLCGPNSMGLHDFHSKLRITPFDVPLNRKPGGVGLISQSGSVLGALINNGRCLQFSQVISTGSETVTTAADYLSWMVEQSETRCVGMFLEAVRDPQRFMDALERAAQQDIPVVIVKVGRSALGAKLAVSHTGALVGNDDVFRAVVERFGGHLADSIDEMAALLAVFSQGRKPSAKGLATIHDSGGERELVADLAETEGVLLAQLSASTKARVQSVLEDGIHAENPLDAWGTGQGAEHTYEEATVAMLSDPAVGLGFYVLNWRDGYDLHSMHERALYRAFTRTEKPLLAVSNYASSRSEDLADRLGDAGIPVIGGLQNAMRAARAFLEWRTSTPSDAVSLPNEHAGWARDLLRSKTWISEADGYAILACYGIDVPQHALVDSQEAAVSYAKELGRAVICKTAKEGVSHKTDVGGVVFDLKNPEAVAKAYDRLSATLSSEVLVAEMVPTGSEWSIGAINDPDFGPAIRIAPGGTMVELLQESALLLAPFDQDTAKSAILSLRASRVLQGYRGQVALDISGLAASAAALSRLVWDLRDCLSEVEINPVIVSEKRAVAADAIVQMKP